jgi:hypothetical protein
MKKILSSLAALGLAITATSAFAQTVEPKQITSTYYGLSADEHVLGLLAEDTVSEGSHRYAWIMLFNRVPLIVGGTPFDMGWLLIDTDCAANTSRIVRIELQGAKKIAGPKENDPAKTITEGTPAAEIANVVCHGKVDSARVITKETVEKMLAAYRASAVDPSSATANTVATKTS